MSYTDKLERIQKILSEEERYGELYGEPEETASCEDIYNTQNVNGLSKDESLSLKSLIAQDLRKQQQHGLTVAFNDKLYLVGNNLKLYWDIDGKFHIEVLHEGNVMYRQTFSAGEFKKGDTITLTNVKVLTEIHLS